MTTTPRSSKERRSGEGGGYGLLGDNKEEDVLMEGYLWKKGALGITKGWKRRYFRMCRPNRISYFATSADSEPINFILLNEHTIVSPSTEVYNYGKGKCGFFVRCDYTHRVYYLEAPTPEDMTAWVLCVSQLVQRIKREKEVRPISTQLPSRVVKRKNYPVLDVLLGELQCEGLSGDLFCALYCTDQKFKTWRAKKTPKDSVDWDAACSFSNPASHLVFRLFQNSGNIKRDHPLTDEIIIPVDVFQDAEIHEEWFNFELKNKLKGSIRMKIHLTWGYDKGGMLGKRGIPVMAIPVRLDTGDIVLFNSSHLLSYGTKLFTWSQWDHVAIVVRTMKNRLKLLEVTSEGVGYYDLDERIDFLSTVSKIGVRFLTAERTPKMHDAIWEYVDEVKGRPFKQDLMEMVNAAQKRHNEEDQSSLFCSQLVAAAYQRMGLMSNDRPSNDFVPKDWASKKNTTLSLKPGVHLNRKLIFKVRDDFKKDKTKKRTAFSENLGSRLRTSTLTKFNPAGASSDPRHPSNSAHSPRKPLIKMAASSSLPSVERERSTTVKPPMLDLSKTEQLRISGASESPSDRSPCSGRPSSSSSLSSPSPSLTLSSSSPSLALSSSSPSLTLPSSFEKKKKHKSNQPNSARRKSKNSKKQKQQTLGTECNITPVLTHHQIKELNKFSKKTPKDTLTQIPKSILPLPSSSPATTPQCASFSSFDYLMDLNRNPIAQL